MEPTLRKRPDAAAVAWRAMALAVLVHRGMIEYQTVSESDGVLREAQADVEERMVPWMREQGIWGALSASERSLFERRVGAWSHQDVVDVSWRNESLGVLAWALGMIEDLPCSGAETSLDATLGQMPLGADARRFVEGAQLRTDIEISHGRDVAALWHWRCRMEQMLRGEIALPEGMSAEDVREEVRMTAHHARQFGDLEETLAEDFVYQGRAFGAQNDAEFKHAFSLATERHYALNWLCGLADDWDGVSTDT